MLCLLGSNYQFYALSPKFSPNKISGARLGLFVGPWGPCGHENLLGVYHISAPLYVVMMVLVILPHVSRSPLRIMGLGPHLVPFCGALCSKCFFSGVGQSGLFGDVNFPHRKVHVVPPTCDQIQFWAGAHFGLLMGPKHEKKFCLWPLYTPCSSPLHVGMVWDGNFDLIVGLFYKLWDFGPHLVPFWRAFCSGYFFWHGPFCVLWDVNIHNEIGFTRYLDGLN